MDCIALTMDKSIRKMCLTDMYLVVLVVLCTTAVISTAQTAPDSLCFRFTWLGPQYNNRSQFLNATCSDATQLASGVPCVQPLVASFDGSWPDVDYIWNNHAEEATCILSQNDVCAQYTYYFNGIAENSTYMCTRAIDNNDAAITRGCYQQTNGSFATRVCFCRSVPGGVPCNAAIINSIISMTTIVFALVLAMNTEFVDILRRILP